MAVRAKKYLGQHFLTDENIARKIIGSSHMKFRNVLEVGPGMGILTKFLLQNPDINLKVVEIDVESVQYLKEKFPELSDKIIHADFLELNLDEIYDSPYSIIGNFPYNISSQILFKVLEYRNRVHEVVGMFQKEVAQRVASPPGSKEYGILSVLLQAFYDIEYLFSVNANVFSPPPNVKSGVIRLTRNQVSALPCDEKLFFKIVKTAFNQRRKMLRNGLREYIPENIRDNPVFDKRAEQLAVDDFIALTKMLDI